MQKKGDDIKMTTEKKLSMPIKTLIGLICGVIAGSILGGNNAYIAKNFISPFGTLFLNAIKMVVVPMVFSSIIVGVCGIGDAKSVGRIGGKTVVYFLCTTVFAATFGIIAANVFHIGEGFVIEGTVAEVTIPENPGIINTLINIIPSNPIQSIANGDMLQIIAFAIIVGGGIVIVGEKAQPVFKFFNGMAEIMFAVTGVIMKFTPIAVFALITPVVAENGISVLLPLASVVLVVYGTCIVHAVVVYSLSVKIFSGISPLKFFKNSAEAIVFAFTSASSSATLPYSMQSAEKMKVSESVSSFVLPLGSTINMDGTAIYQGICALFIANVYGIELTLVQQITIVLTCTFASVGAAGIPGSAMIMLSMVLQSVGLPVEGIGLVAGIDRITDMAPTATNITGDIACSVVVAATEGELGKDE